MEMAMGLESDLTQLDDLSDQTILERLKGRYERDLIYTRVSDILIAVNPCKPLPLYDTAHHTAYRWDNLDANAEPHVFNVAAAAYRRMRETENDQVIIVSGESGAGKTESTKHMLRHMVHMCQGGQMDLHDKIVKVNPLLESFGNAKTLMNTNSSRFAKYLELWFDKNDGMLRGAVVRDYMLEKSRVMHQSQMEGTFHIFYALFAGCPKEKRNDLFLQSQAGEYRIMKSDIESLDMEDHYRHMYKENMEILQQINVDTEIVLNILASVINIADIEFLESDQGSAEITDAAPYCHAALLLDLNEENLGHSLITSKRTIRGQEIVTYKTVKQAEDSRDALAKVLYERMFGWLVRQINKDIQSDRSYDPDKIGILDIAGFEKLRSNSFEQICINLVNEKLQYFMNKRIFLTEMEIYKDEGIPMEGITFKNNEDIIQLFEKPTVGLLAILDETTRYQQGSDEYFVNQLNGTYGQSPLYTKAKSNRPEFGIKHFAAQVWYDGRNFLEKNRDRLNDELMEVMKDSNNPFISDLFTVKRGPTGSISGQPHNYRASRRAHETGHHHTPRTPKDGRDLAMELGRSVKKRFGIVSPPSEGMTQVAPVVEHVTLTSYFRNSLLELLGKIGEAEPFFIRCLKANTDLAPDFFDSNIVADQLQYNGIAEVAKIRKMGYPVRKPYSEFLKRYRCLHQSLPMSETNREKVRCILLLTPPEYHRDFRCGRSKAFMTETVEIWIEKKLWIRHNTASRTISRCIRSYIEVKKRRIAEEEARRRAEELAETIAQEPIQHKPIPPTNSPPMYKPPERPQRVPEPTPSPQLSKPPISPEPSPPPSDNEEDNNLESGTETREFWDLCQVIARERKPKDVHEQRSLQVIKAVTYVLLFCILLFCAVAQKIALAILTADQYNVTSTRTASDHEEDMVIKAGRYYLIAIAIMIPYGLTLITSTLKWIFGGFMFPHTSTFIVCFLMEGCHSVGLSFLCFVILPQLDMGRGILILGGVAIIPAILKPVFASDAKIYGTKANSCSKRFCIMCMDLIAIVIQCGYIPLVIITDHFKDHSYLDFETGDIIKYTFTIFLISFSWWENYIDNRCFGSLQQNNFWHKFIMSIKFDLQESRPIISTFMSLWKIGWTCLMCWLLDYIRQDDEHRIGQDKDPRDYMTYHFSAAFDKFSTQPLAENSSILTLTLAAFVGHYVGYTACKLKLQRFSYDIPLFLSTPLAVVIVTLDCDHHILEIFTDEILVYGCPDTMDNWWHYLTAGVVWLSLYWIGRHIFFPNIERLAKTERLFLNPYYCGILFEQHMVLNRKRHNRKIYREIKEGNTYFRLSKYDTTVNVEGEEEEDRSGSGGTEDTKSDYYMNPKFRDVPFIYACATMWHENRQEMLQLMKSLFRMDRDQCLRRQAELISGQPDKEFYDFEAHILFDDAMELNDDEEWVPNQFVKLMMSIIDEAASCVYEKRMKVKPPIKVPSPYGGQLIWTMPGDNFLYLHLKDKQKIRHRKRWSQVMYMYYLLGFRIVRECQETVTAALSENKLSELVNWGKDESWGQVGRSHIFRVFDEQVLRKASNTFLLALDGDVDFSPGAVRLLLDRMRKSEKVGAACGRIHPIGTGPIVWFQKFEYAIAHWLQKATEHVLGCVLCSPGCFSLFRGSALMDDNIMKKYTIQPTEPMHHLMYDQGEDRWLCTLLLQQGYRVDYAAGSDAFTYAPEGFGEFFNQRRRWMPSTVANIVDLLADYKNTVYVNSNISILYIFYQAGLLVSTVVGPATVLMMIAGANLIVFKVNLINAYIIALSPGILYFALCFIVKPAWQILAAEILSAFYAFVMMIVFVGTAVAAVQESPFHPSVVFIAFLVFLFSFAAILHPKEWTCVLFGVLYFLCIPTGFLLLVFYSVCNLHVVSWGTREVAKKKTKAEIAAEKQKQEEKKKKKKEQGFFGRFFPQTPLKDFKELLASFTAIQTDKQKYNDPESIKILKDINDGINKLVDQKKGSETSITDFERRSKDDPSTELIDRTEKGKGILRKTKGSETKKHVGIAETVSIRTEGRDVTGKVKPKRDEMKNPAWAETPELGKGEIFSMREEEAKFWKGFVNKYLKPLDMTEDQKKNMHKGLIELRNNACLAMAMINLLWVAINFMFQLSSPTKISIKVSETQTYETEEDEEAAADDPLITVDVLGLMFIIFFLIILLLQCCGMVVHRWGTFLHLVSVTELRNPFERTKKTDTETGDTALNTRDALKVVEQMWNEPLPDYPSDEETESDTDEIKEELTRLMTTGTRFRVSIGRPGIMGASSRHLGTDFNANPALSRDLRRTATAFADQIRLTSRFDIAPDKDMMRRVLQDGYQKKKDSRYKDRPLPPIKENKFDLKLGKEELVSRLKERNLDSKLGLRQPGSRPIVPDDDDNMYQSIPMPRKGTFTRGITRRFNIMAKERHLNGRPRSVEFNITDSGRPRPENTRHGNNYVMSSLTEIQQPDDGTTRKNQITLKVKRHSKDSLSEATSFIHLYYQDGYKSRKHTRIAMTKDYSNGTTV